MVTLPPLPSTYHFFIFKICVFYRYHKYFIVPGVFYSTWNFPGGILYAHKNDHAINKEW